MAETGSGKTGAFALPVLQTLLENPQRLYALVLTPTRFVSYLLLINNFNRETKLMKAGWSNDKY